MRLKKLFTKKNLLISFIVVFIIFMAFYITFLVLSRPTKDKVKFGEGYEILIDTKKQLDKYSSFYEIYQLNTNKIFKINDNRYFSNEYNYDFSNIKNITSPEEVDLSNNNLKILVSNYEGLSINDTYNKTLELLKANENVRLYIVGTEDVSYSNNTKLILSPINSDSVYAIYSYQDNYGISDVDMTTSNLKLKQRPQLYTYVYYSVWNLEENYFINK